jgi:hypothetical protein
MKVFLHFFFPQRFSGQEPARGADESADSSVEVQRLPKGNREREARRRLCQGLRRRFPSPDALQDDALLYGEQGSYGNAERKRIALPDFGVR